jgi:inosine-uridine nucleoside N-ribohydrolase
LVSPLTANAQSPSSFWIPPYLPREIPAAPAVEAAGADDTVSLPLIVDTDPGVDDAVALAWLLNVLAPEDILGIVTVAGNTTVENATRNAHTVLSLFCTGETSNPVCPNIPVITGASKPLSQKLSATGKLIHGFDGLWGAQMAQVARAPRKEAVNFYCSNAEQNPSATILAIGPLTNIAEAIRHCRGAMDAYERIVILGGAKHGGNTTPVAEFNFWQDPEAAQIVFQSGMNIDLMPLDAFSQFGFSPLELAGFPGDPGAGLPPVPSIFQASTNPAFRYLAFPVTIYAVTQIQAGVQMPSLPDLAAAIYTIQNLGATTGGLVEIINRPEAVRGQSIIGFGIERVTMIADQKEQDDIAKNAFERSTIPGFPDQNYVTGRIIDILSRVPDNAQVVVYAPADGLIETMRNQFLALLSAPAGATSVGGEGLQQMPQDESIYLPSIGVD